MELFSRRKDGASRRTKGAMAPLYFMWTLMLACKMSNTEEASYSVVLNKISHSLNSGAHGKLQIVPSR